MSAPAAQGSCGDSPKAVAEAPLLSAEPGCGRGYRVLHVLDHSWPLLSGYSVRSRSLVRAERMIGLQPQILTGPLHQLDDASGGDATVDGLPYFRTPLSKDVGSRAIAARWPVLREMAVVRLLRRRILDLLDSLSFDIVHAHSPALCGLAALQAARLRNLPCVYEIRAFWEDGAVDQKKTQPRALRYRASRRLENYVVERADAVVGIAQHILQELRTRGVSSEKMFWVPNGVDCERFQPQPRDNLLATELGLKDEVVLGFIGSLYHFEGVSWLVRAVAELRRRGVRCRLLILGEGEDAPAIAQAIRETGAQDYVLPMGRVPHDDVQRFYSVMDVLVYPRRNNRLTDLVTPLKPLEAMAQGKAVLGSHVGGIAELIEHEQTGILFAPEDVDAFCDAARRLIEQPGLRRQLGVQAREAVSRQKEWKVLAQKYPMVYEYALSARGRAGDTVAGAGGRSE